jgi:hypothetical protein
MGKPALMTCMIFAATVGFTAAATANHHHHQHHHWARAGRPAPPPESLTSVGTPDCHVQGRFLRIAHHCPPDAIAAARSW